MKAIMGTLVTIWVFLGMVAWAILVSACGGTYDPRLLEQAEQSAADAGTDEDAGPGYEVTGP